MLLLSLSAFCPASQHAFLALFSVEQPYVLHQQLSDEAQIGCQSSREFTIALSYVRDPRTDLTDSTLLAACSQRQMQQFIASLEKMSADSIWAGRNRFDSFAPIRLNVSAQWLVDGVSNGLCFVSGLIGMRALNMIYADLARLSMERQQSIAQCQSEILLFPPLILLPQFTNSSIELDPHQKCVYIHDWWQVHVVSRLEKLLVRPLTLLLWFSRLSPELYMRRPAQAKYRLDNIMKKKAEEGVKFHIIV